MTKNASLLLAAPLVALACSKTPTPEPAPASKDTAGSPSVVEAPSAKAPSVDRSPIAVKEGSEKLSLSAAAFKLEVLGDTYMNAMYLENRVIGLHPLRGGALVSFAGYWGYIKDHQIELCPRVGAFPETYELKAVAGAHPGGVIARVEFNTYGHMSFLRAGDDGRDGQVRQTSTYRLSGEGADLTSFSGSWTRGAAFRDGTFLTLQGPDAKAGGPPPKQALVLEPKGGKKASPVEPPKQAAPRDAALCKDASVEVAPEDVDALPSGEAFVLGKRCSTGGYALERWGKEGAESEVEDAPDAPKDVKRAFISASAPDRLHIMLSNGERVYAARWDGRALRRIELADEGDVRAMWTAADGTLFFVLHPKSKVPKKDSTELVRVLSSGELARSKGFVAGPNLKLWAADAQTAYFASYNSVFSTKPGVSFIECKPSEPAAGKPKAPEPPRSGLPAFAEGCATPFVFLYNISEKSPPGFTFPSTRKALAAFEGVAEISLIEFMDASQRKLGVRVPSADVGKRLVAHVEATMKDEHPELVCADPKEGVRAIAIRDASGAP